jgi:membrane-associated phospholipid phosphatase
MQRVASAFVFIMLAAATQVRAEDPPAAEPTASSILSTDARDRIFYPSDTERIKPLTIKLTGNILLDQKDIWTSPFRMNRRTAKWWLLGGAATAALIVTDKHTINAFRNAPTQVEWGNNVSKVGAAYTVIPVAAGFYIAGAVVDDAKARETGVLATEALLDSLIVQSVLKPIAGRDRPNVAHTHQKWFDGGASFPSGHSMEAWALASVISHEYSHRKWVPFVAYGLATVTGMARYTAQQHYASDIVAGGAIGWFIGRYVYQNHQDHARHIHRLNPRIAPLYQPTARTYGVALTLN